MKKNKTNWFLMFTLGFATACSAGTEAPPKGSTAKKSIELLCGKHTWKITCGHVKNDDYPERYCNKNTLTITDELGKTVVVKDPDVTEGKPRRRDDRASVMFEDSTPRSLWCINTPKGSYMKIEYSRDTSAAGVFFETFESNGASLTLRATPIKNGYKNPLEIAPKSGIGKPINIEEGN